MTGLSDRSAQGVLNHLTGQAAIFAEPTAYVALFTSVGSDSGSGFTEPSGGGYARVATAAASWNAASGDSPSLISNAAPLAFPTATGSWGTVIAMGLYDAPTGGNLLAWDYLGAGFVWQPCTISDAAPGVFTAPAHGFAVNDNVVFTTEYGGTPPAFSQSNLTGILVVAHAATDTLDVTNGGVAVNTAATASGMIRKIVPQQIVQGVQAIFNGGAPGQLVLSLA